VTRNSYSGDNGLNQACDWVADELSKLGFEVERNAFQSSGGSMTPQIVATIKGTDDPDSIVVLGAHFDSRTVDRVSPTARAPGADDNGTGSAAMLEFARIIHQKQATFKNTIRLCLFTGEEQGLVGSRAVAREWANNGDKVIAMFNADMLGYKQPGSDITMGIMERYADPDLSAIAISMTNTYVPALNVRFTQVCCSDQQSFYENGYPSVGFFETPSPGVVYPQYHQSADLLDYLDPVQITLQATAAMASAITYAELNLAPPASYLPSVNPALTPSGGYKKEKA
jgi:Zn-dependent M28 family amino/carboxypeptidase